MFVDVCQLTCCGSVDILVCQWTYTRVSIDMLCVGLHAVCQLTCCVSSVQGIPDWILL